MLKNDGKINKVNKVNMDDEIFESRLNEIDAIRKQAVSVSDDVDKKIFEELDTLVKKCEANGSKLLVLFKAKSLAFDTDENGKPNNKFINKKEIDELGEADKISRDSGFWVFHSIYDDPDLPRKALSEKDYFKRGEIVDLLNNECYNFLSNVYGTLLSCYGNVYYTVSKLQNDIYEGKLKYNFEEDEVTNDKLDVKELDQFI